MEEIEQFTEQITGLSLIEKIGLKNDLYTKIDEITKKSKRPLMLNDLTQSEREMVVELEMKVTLLN